MAGKRKRPRTAAQTRAARDAILVYHRTRHLRPKCGAKKRSDGEPCCRVAMANGKCYMHGGKTPRGAEWHKPVFPKGGKNWQRRFYRKLDDLERARKERDRRVSLMTREEREEYERWLATHPPGKRKPTSAAQTLTLTDAKPALQSPELLALETRIQKLKSLIAAMEAANDGTEISS